MGNLPYAITDELNAANATVTEALRAGRRLTAAERSHIDRVLAAAADAKTNADLADSIEAMRRGSAPGRGVSDGFGAKLAASGFHTKHRPSVVLSAFDALGAGAKATLPAAGDLAPMPPEDVSPLGRDRRFLWPFLDRRRVEPGITAISDFRQTGARTITGSVERDVTATTEKATVALAVQAVTTTLRQVAVLVDKVPNVVLEGEELWREFFDAEGRQVLDQALDTHAIGAILAATPPNGAIGTGLVAQVRNGVAAMRQAGANPTLLVVSGDDAASLDLTEDAGGYVFPVRDSGTASPLWGLRVVETSTILTEPLLIDPRRLGPLFLGALRVDADPFTGFANNTTDLRYEVAVLQHVRRFDGAFRVAAV
ncbi:hypothetical protein E9529_15775 [Blastococcus sp. KM273128]|uniref:hypothetical protein n=1 Tax=Blastococcus sp. KM273128 TaxID=2570314 RepID=UPI001F385664|nr:hypothetical protein [Blastococcus sp. KM273128]MCF6745705.1 hypothetical protein [Blastococcus sp. KM273128]